MNHFNAKNIFFLMSFLSLAYPSIGSERAINQECLKNQQALRKEWKEAAKFVKARFAMTNLPLRVKEIVIGHIADGIYNHLSITSVSVRKAWCDMVISDISKQAGFNRNGSTEHFIRYLKEARDCPTFECFAIVLGSYLDINGYTRAKFFNNVLELKKQISLLCPVGSLCEWESVQS